MQERKTEKDSLTIGEVARILRPRYHFAGMEGIFYERQPYRQLNLCIYASLLIITLHMQSSDTHFSLYCALAIKSTQLGLISTPKFSSLFVNFILFTIKSLSLMFVVFAKVIITCYAEKSPLCSCLYQNNLDGVCCRNHQVLIESARHVTRFIGLANVANKKKEKVIVFLCSYMNRFTLNYN